MSSIVLELQQMATDSSHDIANLLRRAKLVAVKLKLDDFRQWIDHELNGYGYNAVPEYRKVHAQLFANNPCRGLIPFMVEDPKIADLAHNVELIEPISSLIHLLANYDSKQGPLKFPFPPPLKKVLMEIQLGGIALEPVRVVTPNAVAAILDAVRTTILEWSLALEEQGILGDEIQFSEDEKQKAASTTEIHIGNFQGTIGDIANSNVTQNLHMEVSKGDFDSLKKHLLQHDVLMEDVDELQEALEAEPTPEPSGSFGKRVSGWIGKMVGKAASGAWEVGMTAASDLLSSGIRSYYGLQ
jgi:hypothetical protein